MSKVVVFGGAGFLGSHVADALTQRGHKVVIFDKVASPHVQAGQEMIVGNIMNLAAVHEAVAGADYVYNFVAQADIELSIKNPIETAQLNVIGNMHVLEACRIAKVKRFVFSSSIYVYSDMGSVYRSSKQASELFIENYQKDFGLNYTILRYGSLYGPRSNESNWIYRVLKQALTEGKITREGDGEELREYIHVYDAARLSVDILADQYVNRCFLVTGNEQIKIKDLLRMVQEIMKGEIKVEYIPAKDRSHYEITPYVFKPQIASKIKSNEQIDMGEGLIQILSQLHQQHIISQSKK